MRQNILDQRVTLSHCFVIKETRKTYFIYKISYYQLQCSNVIWSLNYIYLSQIKYAEIYELIKQFREIEKLTKKNGMFL